MSSNTGTHRAHRREHDAPETAADFERLGWGRLPLADFLGLPEPRYTTVIDREAVKPNLASLPERERRILYMRFFLDMTQARMGEELGISQMHVSRLLARACEKVRMRVQDTDAAWVTAA